MSRWKKTADQIAKEIREETALIAAVKEKNEAAVQRLLEAGVSPDAREYNRCLYYASENYFSPLHYAAENGSPKIVSMLLRRKANQDAKDRYDVTPLHIAAKHGCAQCVKLLLEAGADCNAATKHPRPGLFLETEMPYPGGSTPLHLAASNNNVLCAVELIWYGADYNLVDEHGRTSLYVAAEKGYSECVMGHLTNAVRIAILSIPVFNSGDTPLHECVRKGMTDCVTELVKLGSDVGHRNVYGLNPLHLALRREDFNFDIVKQLVLYGYNVDLDAKDVTGLSPLHYVCFTDSRPQQRRSEVAAFLIAMGANPNIYNKNGESLLISELRQKDPKYDDTILTAIYECTPVLAPLLKVIEASRCFKNRPAFGRVRRPVGAKYDRYEEIASNPRSLQHLTRCAVRQAMGHKRIRRTPYLPIPPTLKEYLLFGQEVLPYPYV
ncbi:hypothetical protein BaRGS_00029390 [Batillaria attramentaria]|uniref:SOCS box domain-containing protein n=1 Tax=Batillaria attramentaria TaxID=370345 RepID=A0ABD0JXA0_9CAEN